jgi:hypothetical protein
MRLRSGRPSRVEARKRLESNLVEADWRSEARER